MSVAEFSTHENQRVTKALNDGLQAALTGTKTPAQAMKDAQAEADRILRALQVSRGSPAAALAPPRRPPASHGRARGPRVAAAAAGAGAARRRSRTGRRVATLIDSFYSTPRGAPPGRVGRPRQLPGDGRTTRCSGRR